ncbi:MAG: PspA/IM30 family protein, partial [Anaerolineae bacterium]
MQKTAVPPDTAVFFFVSQLEYNLGMTSLFKKLRTLFRASLHEAADKALQKSDLAVYDQYIREAEKEVEEFTKSIRPMFAQVKTTKRRREALADKAAR